jgi:hypothetical protein
VSLPPQNSDDRHIGIIGDSKQENTETGRPLEREVYSKFCENPSIDSQVIERRKKTCDVTSVSILIK